MVETKYLNKRKHRQAITRTVATFPSNSLAQHFCAKATQKGKTTFDRMRLGQRWPKTPDRQVIAQSLSPEEFNRLTRREKGTGETPGGI